MLNIKVHEFTKFTSMRDPSGVSSGWSSLSLSSGWFCRRFHGPLLLSVTVASLHYQRCPGGTHWSIKLLLHIRHILEGIILLYSSPLLLAREKVIKNLVPYLVPPGLLKGGEIVLIVHLEYAFQVFLPSLAPKSGHPL